MRRESTGGQREVLLSLERLRVRDWTEIARSTLVDALTEPPTVRLARDYGRFLSLEHVDPIRVAGSDLERWLETWNEEGWWSMFKGRRG